METLTASSNLTFYYINKFQDIFVKLCNQNNYDWYISAVADTYQTDFKPEDLKNQLGQFPVIVA